MKVVVLVTVARQLVWCLATPEQEQLYLTRYEEGYDVMNTLPLMSYQEEE